MQSTILLNLLLYGDTLAPLRTTLTHDSATVLASRTLEETMHPETPTPT